MAQGQYAPALIQEKTLKFIDENKENLFFLYVPTVLPHAELSGPDDKYYQLYADRFDEKPHKGNDYGPQATVSGYASVEKPHAMYASMVSRMDAYVGQIVDRLRENKLLDNTIIIFTSDNGSHKEGGADPNFFNSSGGLRGNKRDLYEGGIKTLSLFIGMVKLRKENLKLPGRFLGYYADDGRACRDKKTALYRRNFIFTNAAR
jgi:arylsulfatase A-like enzyme